MARGDTPHRSWDFAVDGFIGGSCVIAQDGTIYAETVTTLYALTPDGRLKWKTPLHTAAGDAWTNFQGWVARRPSRRTGSPSVRRVL
jgi:outer membrane protein assembly factor BamB